jgi:hypothetical protein
MDTHELDPTMSFAVHDQVAPAIEIRVNFGVFAGRTATRAELDRLAAWLLDEVGEVSIVSEERHEFDAQVEASVHQVRIELSADRTPADPAERRELEARILERAEHWARLCVDERHAEVSDGV